jgi:pyridoxal phosphate enzyme (YggS family)
MTEPDSPLARLQFQIAQAAEAAGRHAADVTLLAVGKRQSPAAIRALFEKGQRAFAENYVQEALTKQALLADIDIVWHFIGRIQRNKTRDIAAHFDWVHTVDRAEVAERLSDQRPPARGPLNCLIEVNVSGEASKSGCTPQEAPALALAIIQYPSLSLRGVMAIPAASDDPVAQRAAFARARGVYVTIKVVLQQQAAATPLGPAARALPRFDTLSMGMSADLEAAIAEGATLVRVGSAIFGDRSD